MRQVVAHTLGSFVILALLAASPGEALGQSAASPAIPLLLSARPGTYLVRDRTLEPAAPSAALAVFLQADALRADEASGVLVPLSFGVQAPAGWTLGLEVHAAGAEGGQPVAVLSLAGSAGLAREQRELTLSPGEYEMAVAVAVPRGDGTWVGTTERQRLSVPNPRAGLAASPLVIGERVASAAGSGAPKPFVFGTAAITPAATNRFRQSDRLNVALRVEGWKPDEASKPDVTVEYVFRQRMKDRLVFFNKTKPQTLAAATLPKTFDGGRGTVATGMVIPLAAFPAGDFQLEVRVTDRRTRVTTVQQARFSVS